MSTFQRKIMQDVITLAVFVPFAMIYIKDPFKLDYLWAALCMVGAVYFHFLKRLNAGERGRGVRRLNYAQSCWCHIFDLFL